MLGKWRTILRNLLVTLGYLSLGAMSYAGYWMVQQPWFFPVQHIHLATPLKRIQEADVRKIAGQEMKGNLFTADIAHVRQTLERLPWVRRVNIRRDFPDHITIELEEYQAFAHWNQQALINQAGEVFFVPDAKKQVLPSLIAPDGMEKQVISSYVQFNQQLEKINLSVKQLTLSPRHAWQLRLNNDMVLELGRENMKQRLARLITVYPYSLGALHNTVKSVDLRYRNGFAVQW